MAQLNSIEAYRQRATEIRAEAKRISNVHAQKRLLETADSYDALARALEKQQLARKAQTSK